MSLADKEELGEELLTDCSILDIDVISKSEWDCKSSLHRATAISESEKEYLGSSARFRPETILKKIKKEIFGEELI